MTGYCRQRSGMQSEYCSKLVNSALFCCLNGLKYDSRIKISEALYFTTGKKDIHKREPYAQLVESDWI